MALVHERIVKFKDVDHPNLGDLFEEIHVVSFTTTAQTVEVSTNLSSLVYGYASPFAAVAAVDPQDTPLNVHPTIGVDTPGKVTVRRQASGTSGLQICVVLGGYKTSSS